MHLLVVHVHQAANDPQQDFAAQVIPAQPPVRAIASFFYIKAQRRAQIPASHILRQAHSECAETLSKQSSKSLCVISAAMLH